jgi:hypothetical protein
MNIFALHPDARTSAQYHCDQHLHKMILESAQMLSTVIQQECSTFGSSPPPGLYFESYPKHPCNLWLKQGTANIAWLICLATSLENIRINLNAPPHDSMSVINTAIQYYELTSADILTAIPNNFIFCGPLTISWLPSKTVHEKYHLYYQRKAEQWASGQGLTRPRQMSYKGRPAPKFMEGYI